MTLALLGSAGCGTGAQPIVLAGKESGVRLVTGRELSDPAAIDAGLAERARRAPRGRVHLYVRMKARLTLDDHRELDRAGAMLLDYLGHETYVVSLPTPVDFENLPYSRVVRWVQELLPEDKLHPELLAKKDKDRIAALVVFFADVGSTSAVDALRAVGLEGTLAGDERTWRVEASLEELRALTAEPSVSIVVPHAPPPRSSNDVARGVAGTEQVQDATTITTGTTTQTVLVLVAHRAYAPPARRAVGHTRGR